MSAPIDIALFGQFLNVFVYGFCFVLLADYNLGVQVLDAFVNIKRQVAEVVTAWNER